MTRWVRRLLADKNKASHFYEMYNTAFQENVRSISRKNIKGTPICSGAVNIQIRKMFNMVGYEMALVRDKDES